MTSSEHAEQSGFIQWFHEHYPSVLIFSIPNGEHRAISSAVRLKKEGLTPGIPDLFIPKYKIFLEMKRIEGGKISKEQEEIMRYLTRVGYICLIGYGATDASRKVQEVINKV